MANLTEHEISMDDAISSGYTYEQYLKANGHPQQNDFFAKFANALTGVYSGNSAAWEQKYNEYQLKKQREYEEYMNSTQYQRAIKDLYAAGFTNPHAILAANNASPASASVNSSANSYNSNKQQSGQGKNLALTALAIARIIAILAA